MVWFATIAVGRWSDPAHARLAATRGRWDRESGVNASMRVASWFAYGGAVISIIGIALLVLFFAFGEPYGHLNDVAVVVQYLLALPLVLALHRVLRLREPALSTVALVLGVAAVAAIALLQIMVIAPVLKFSQQVGPITFSLFVLFGGWLLITGYLSRSHKLMPHSVLMSVIGWTYFGYPAWAFWLGRRLALLNEASEREW